MTQRQYKIDEWLAVMGHREPCFKCGNPATEAAHIIANTKNNINKYGFYCVNNRHNLRSSCQNCNSAAMHLQRDLDDKERLLQKCNTDLKERGIDPHKGRL